MELTVLRFSKVAGCRPEFEINAISTGLAGYTVMDINSSSEEDEQVGASSLEPNPD